MFCNPRRYFGQIHIHSLSKTNFSEKRFFRHNAATVFSIKVRDMQSKSISLRFLKSTKLSMCVLGAVFLCTFASLTLAATSFDTTKILKSSQPQKNPEVIEFLAGDDDKAKLLFFREAFEKQKIHLFEKPQQYFEQDYPLKDYV